MPQKRPRPRLLQAMLDAFRLPDLRRRILFTLGMLVAFRFIAHIPLPGVDSAAMADLFQSNAMLGMLDMFSGGAMRQFSVAAMGVYPYITASIVMLLLTPVIPWLQAMAQEGEAGQRKINQITHWLTVPLAALAGFGQIILLRNAGVLATVALLPTIAMITSLVAGTVFLVWLGELITEYGIGNGISIIIFGGIVAGLPETVGQAMVTSTNRFVPVIVYALIALATIVVIVIFTEAHRRIPVQYARSVFRSGRMYKQSGSSHIPLRVNSAGVLPIIFANAMVIFPSVVANYFANPEGMEPNFANHIVNIFSPNADIPLGLVYWGLLFLLVVAFAFFYTSMVFNQQDLPGTLQRQGGFIPGVRPGKQTHTYLNGVIGRITWAGALYLALVAVMPFLARQVTDIQAIQLSSLGLLIMVSVVLDTMKQLEAQLAMRRYEGFIK